MLLKHENNLKRSLRAKELYAELGNVCFTLSTEPVRSICFTESRSLQFNSKLKNYLNIQRVENHVNKPNERIELLLRLSLLMFKKAATLDENDWQYEYMQAIIMKKLSLPFEIVASKLLLAIHKLPEDSGIKEQEKIWDVHCNLISYIIKHGLKVKCCYI